MMRHNWKKLVACGAAALAALFIGACGQKAGTVKETQEFEQTEAELTDGDAAAQNVRPDSSEEAENEEKSSKPALPEIVNPIQEVGGSGDFEAIGISLNLPENPDWCEEPSYSILDGKIAQILFYDTIADSVAMVRAADKKEEDISGIYYVFDDAKRQSWFTTTKEGDRIEITVQVTIDNSDVHGALAAWTYGQTQYSLWEDNVGDAVEAAAKMAIGIAKASADPGEAEE